jgi:predicted membrane channel-forming protein YqfA (hemolysin III family)
MTALSLWLPEYLAWGVAFLAFLSCCPERFFAEVFDYMFNSHQIFHVLCVCCAYWHLLNLVTSREGMFPVLLDV